MTILVHEGVPEADRAELIASLAFAATGVCVSAAVAARNLETNPLGFLGETMELLQRIVTRR